MFKSGPHLGFHRSHFPQSFTQAQSHRPSIMRFSLVRLCETCIIGTTCENPSEIIREVSVKVYRESVSLLKDLRLLATWMSETRLSQRLLDIEKLQDSSRV